MVAAQTLVERDWWIATLAEWRQARMNVSVLYWLAHPEARRTAPQQVAAAALSRTHREAIQRERAKMHQARQICRNTQSEIERLGAAMVSLGDEYGKLRAAQLRAEWKQAETVRNAQMMASRALIRRLVLELRAVELPARLALMAERPVRWGGRGHA